MDKIVYDYILVRYGELSTKGKNRNEFIRKLVNNVKFALKEHPKLTYDHTYDRMFIRLHDEDEEIICKKLQKCFGISSFSLALRVNSDIDQISDMTLNLMMEHVGTFKIETRRHDKLFPLKSDDVNRYVAGNILNKTELKVDVHKPDHRVIIEIRKDFSYIMAKTFSGAKGYPVGIGGKAMLMLSGGIDSPVAGYLTMKRGVALECIHYASLPYTSTAALDKVYRLVNKLCMYQGKIKVHVVNFTKLQLAIYENCDESYAITIMRRMMYRIAERIALNNKCLALASGESIGQVASQTLESLYVINEPINIPVLRPLISFDKLEIIDIAKQIDTYDISIEPFEDCCTIFTPLRPVIKPNVNKAKAQELRFDYQTLLEECIDTIHVEEISYKEEELF
ncbi:MAG: tRNA 4-thiouridine(8) synthase ThiI [Erysipelotrichaceae bacterium]|nr:tRNA 4-thiouridine(8) synthase ThiI [Erysipelotrichaceae bacterium]MDD3923603.1 tRNA 4-thiouridine(8) synthase ThiI [Erysipelotrichaceae bacterium]MDD4643114.1 tRNA 4-thiouridine(8) synthase ThiI [Erysipelotrichaceae bacterium]